MTFSVWNMAFIKLICLQRAQEKCTLGLWGVADRLNFTFSTLTISACFPETHTCRIFYNIIKKISFVIKIESLIFWGELFSHNHAHILYLSNKPERIMFLWQPNINILASCPLTGYFYVVLLLNILVFNLSIYIIPSFFKIFNNHGSHALTGSFLLFQQFFIYTEF